MHAKSKIRLDLIEQAHRALDALPEHRPEEVSKTQAIQKLIIPIRATQSKGYSLAAIGQVLAECGIPITTGALRAYLSEAMAGTGEKKGHKTKRTSTAPKERSPEAPQNSSKDISAQQVKPAAKPGALAATSDVDLDWEPAARSNRASPPVGASQLGFEVRPDTRDL